MSPPLIKTGLGITREEAEGVARSLPIPAFKRGDVYERRGRRYVLICAKLLAPLCHCVRTDLKRVRYGYKRTGEPSLVKLADPHGCVFETEAALFFHDPRWPAKFQGSDPATLAVADARLEALKKARAVRAAKRVNEEEV